MHMCMQLAESFLARYQGTREFSGAVPLTMSNRQQVSFEISWSGLADGGGSDIAAQVATFVQFQRDGIGGHSWICSVWSSRWERLKEPKLHSWNSLDAYWLTHGVRKQDKSHWPILWSFFLFFIHPFILFISLSLLLSLHSFSRYPRQPSASL